MYNIDFNQNHYKNGRFLFTKSSIFTIGLKKNGRVIVFWFFYEIVFIADVDDGQVLRISKIDTFITKNLKIRKVLFENFDNIDNLVDFFLI